VIISTALLTADILHQQLVPGFIKNQKTTATLKQIGSANALIHSIKIAQNVVQPQQV
jgi:hypothetical protein